MCNNKKIFLYYKEFQLGCLSQVNDLFFWQPNNNLIEEAIKRYSFGMDMFLLSKEKEIVKDIPPHFSNYLKMIEREDLVEKAQILDSDSDFQKLYKFSGLKFYNQDFVIKQN